MNMKTKLLTALLGGSLIAGNLPASPIVIYDEAFLRTDTNNNNQLLTWNSSNAPAPAYQGNWRTYDAMGNNIPNGNTGVNADQLGRMISNGNGGDNAKGFLFINLSTTNGTNGNVGAQRRDGVNHGIVVRDETPVFNTTAEGYTAAHREWQNLRGFSFDLSRGTSNYVLEASNRAVIQIGSDWFASEQGFNSTPENTWQTHTIADISTANWLTLSFDSGNNNRVTLGTTAQTLAAHGATGILNSVGIHVSTTATTGANNNTQWRTDNIAVTAVPEPGTLALLGLGGLLLTKALRRRK